MRRVERFVLPFTLALCTAPAFASDADRAAIKQGCQTNMNWTEQACQCLADKAADMQCAVQLKLPAATCACISGAAGEQLSDTQQAFMVAQITKDKAAMARLQSSMTVGEMTTVGNFMTSIVGQCQR